MEDNKLINLPVSSPHNKMELCRIATDVNRLRLTAYCLFTNAFDAYFNKDFCL